MGDLLKSELEILKEKFPVMGDVRGEGLFLRIEIIDPQNQNNPHTKLAGQMKDLMKEKQILLGTDGPFNNVIKIKPPLCINRNNVNYFIEQLESILSRMSE